MERNSIGCDSIVLCSQVTAHELMLTDYYWCQHSRCHFSIITCHFKLEASQLPACSKQACRHRRSRNLCEELVYTINIRSMNRMNTPYKQAKSERTNAYLVENYPSIITCGPITFSQSMKEKSYTFCGPLCPHLSSPASSKQPTTRLTYNKSVTNVTFCAVVP